MNWKKYNVQVVERHTPFGLVRTMKVSRCDNKDGIPWDDLQELKNEYLGRDSCAIEFYPPERDVINEVNMRHLWEVDPGLVPMHRH